MRPPPRSCNNAAVGYRVGESHIEPERVKRSSEPSGVWRRHQLEGGRKVGSSLLLENGRRERMSVHKQGERSGESL